MKSEQISQYEKQLRDRKEKKEAEAARRETPTVYAVGQGLGSLAGSYFTESGREEQDRQNRLLRDRDIGSIADEAHSTGYSRRQPYQYERRDVTRDNDELE